MNDEVVDEFSEQPPTAEELASTYRQLRKGREDSKDEPGAADLYYGEMEMRRKSRLPSTRRSARISKGGEQIDVARLQPSETLFNRGDWTMVLGRGWTGRQLANWTERVVLHDLFDLEPAQVRDPGPNRRLLGQDPHRTASQNLGRRATV